MPEPSTSLLTVARADDGVAVVTLDDAPRRNAMTAELTAAWAVTMDALAHDGGLRALVLTGAGPSFSSGGDLGWIAGDPGETVEALRTRMLDFYRTWLAVLDLDVPTVAAVNGPAVGAGLCLALACDLRVAAPSAVFSAPFVRLGMHPGMGATSLLPGAVGAALARDMLLTGRPVDADEALRAGLVSRILPADGFLEAALEVGRAIAATAPIASRATTASLRPRAADLDATLRHEAAEQAATLVSDDLQEGLSAARQRRTPVFRGH